MGSMGFQGSIDDEHRAWKNDGMEKRIIESGITGVTRDEALEQLSVLEAGREAEEDAQIEFLELWTYEEVQMQSELVSSAIMGSRARRAARCSTSSTSEHE
eukprot:gnl/TRDRNA2_/TRDRNA2_207992_c0_seq1.p1 gnl/TRDRNA2_/TRDRNA2_207992_c0~~gnl/TRDRNA2_/TRDRNA2_207992_c0_seq1.p1  ORF type:complete len:101 (+),score=30.91 gnl/TRDRNA2_/TRDRNA2_207992_c0_seq1:128-430(+)